MDKNIIPKGRRLFAWDDALNKYITPESDRLFGPGDGSIER
jgi:hypothetical protein